MTQGNGTALAVRETQSLEFSAEQRQMIRDVFANGASDPEFRVFMEVARARRLNPITRQIHLVKRWNGDLGRNVWTPQTGIDGLRAVAERTGLYDGQDEPTFEYETDGKLKLARVRVYRKDWTRPAVGVAHFSEYAQFKKDGNPNHMWAEKPHIMLAKCAEALALRKAFPEDTSGLYTDDEMPEPTEKTVKPAPMKGKVTDDGVTVDGEVTTDTTLAADLAASVKAGAAAPHAKEGAESESEPGRTGVSPGEDSGGSKALTPAGTQSGQPLPPGPSKCEQLLALLDEVRISGGWKSKLDRAKWRGKHAVAIGALSQSDKATIDGAIDVCGIKP